MRPVDCCLGVGRFVCGGLIMIALELLPSGADAADRDRPPATYHVDATSGDDSNDGRSPATPWRTLAKVNGASLEPGDKVLFKRGETWRGTLMPRSGAASGRTTYAAYGRGPKPRLLGSVTRSRTSDWIDEGGNVWATARPRVEPVGRPVSLLVDSWSLYTEHGARATLRRPSSSAVVGERALEIDCTAGGKNASDVQFYVTGLTVRKGRFYCFSFRARSSERFRVPMIHLMKTGRPWTQYGRARSPTPSIGAEWQEHAIVFHGAVDATDGRITFALGGALPKGARLALDGFTLTECRCDQDEPLSVDVGNLIFDHEKSCGVKVWSRERLDAQGKFYYDEDTWQLKLYSEGNPAGVYSHIECALRRHVIDQTNSSYVTYEDLDLRYGAAHGIGGSNTHHVTVRNCDLAYIGGGDQYGGSRTVRFGNGIEFWSNAHDNLVEGCRLWEIYDAALTNQGSGTNRQVDIVYRHNVIWNCEYSFEYWNRGPASRTHRITFEHNTCVNAGGGWGHAQRPDPNGRHLMFYHNDAQTSDFHVRSNVFCHATESAVRLSNDWASALTMDYNCWFQDKGVLVLWLKEAYSPSQFSTYQARTGKDSHSIVADPRFADAARLDFRPLRSSPVLTMLPDGQAVGALPPAQKGRVSRP